VFSSSAGIPGALVAEFVRPDAAGPQPESDAGCSRAVERHTSAETHEHRARDDPQQPPRCWPIERGTDGAEHRGIGQEPDEPDQVKQKRQLKRPNRLSLSRRNELGQHGQEEDAELGG
jgi:hypothetical protein